MSVTPDSVKVNADLAAILPELILGSESVPVSVSLSSSRNMFLTNTDSQETLENSYCLHVEYWLEWKSKVRVK